MILVLVYKIIGPFESSYSGCVQNLIDFPVPVPVQLVAALANRLRVTIRLGQRYEYTQWQWVTIFGHRAHGLTDVVDVVKSYCHPVESSCKMWAYVGSINFGNVRDRLFGLSLEERGCSSRNTSFPTWVNKTAVGQMFRDPTEKLDPLPAFRCHSKLSTVTRIDRVVMTSLYDY